MRYFLQNLHAVCYSYNADMLPDLLAENASGSWIIYVATGDIKDCFVAMDPLNRSPLAMPHSCAFINLLEDYAAGTPYYVQFQTFTYHNFCKYNHRAVIDCVAMPRSTQPSTLRGMGK